MIERHRQRNHRSQLWPTITAGPTSSCSSAPAISPAYAPGDHTRSRGDRCSEARSIEREYPMLRRRQTENAAGLMILPRAAVAVKKRPVPRPT